MLVGEDVLKVTEPSFSGWFAPECDAFWMKARGYIMGYFINCLQFAYCVGESAMKIHLWPKHEGKKLYLTS